MRMAKSCDVADDESVRARLVSGTRMTSYVDPYSQMEDHEEDAPVKPVRLMTVFSAEFFNRLVQYGVIVEMWDKRKFGRVRRAYQAEFTAAEQRLLDAYYPKLYKWYFSTGLPREITMNVSTVGLLQKATRFFGGI